MWAVFCLFLIHFSIGGTLSTADISAHHSKQKNGVIISVTGAAFRLGVFSKTSSLNVCCEKVLQKELVILMNRIKLELTKLIWRSLQFLKYPLEARAESERSTLQKEINRFQTETRKIIFVFIANLCLHSNPEVAYIYLTVLTVSRLKEMLYCTAGAVC